MVFRPFRLKNKDWEFAYIVVNFNDENSKRYRYL